MTARSAADELELYRERVKRLEARLASRDDLARREAMHEAVLASVLDPTITIDEVGNVLEASDSVERVFGWRPGELVGRNIRTLLPEPYRSEHDGYLTRYRETGTTHILGRTREFPVLHRDGHTVDCELSVSRADVPGRAGPVFTGSFRDVTERKHIERELRDSERRLHAIFDQSFQFVGVLAPDGTVLDVNLAAIAGTGCTREEIVGKAFWEAPCWCHHEDEAAKLREAVRLAASGDFVRFEAEHKNPDGELRSFDLSLKPVRDEAGAIVMLIPEGRDITELKRAQASENAMLRGLAEIGESASVLVHEIKNPITGIKAALAAVAKSLGEDDREVLDDLLGRLQKLERIMRRTLSFTKPVTLQRTTLDLVPWMDSVLATLGPVIDTSPAEVRFDRPATDLRLDADGGLLEEVVSNLIANSLEALEETGRGRTVVVRLRSDDEGGATITVEDDGPGVPESLRAVLFKPFYTTKTRGTGLGLAFCRKVVEEHGGAIAVGESELGGACFTLRLPRRARI